MADMKQMDVEAGDIVINGFTSYTDFVTTMYTTVQAAMNNLVSTWNGKSKDQFDAAWDEYTTSVNNLKQQLDTMKSNLQFEVRQVEETFNG